MQHKLQRLEFGRLRFRHIHERFLLAVMSTSGAILASILAAVAVPANASAQDGMLPCPSMMNVVGGQIDDAISIEGVAEVSHAGSPGSGATETDEVRLTWAIQGNPNCIWVQRAGPGIEFTAMADFVIPPSEVAVSDRPGPFVGEYCYRFFVVSDIGRSEPSRSCIEVINPRLPQGPHDAVPGPPDTGTGSARSGTYSLTAAIAGLALIAASMPLLKPRRAAPE